MKGYVAILLAVLLCQACAVVLQDKVHNVDALGKEDSDVERKRVRENENADEDAFLAARRSSLEAEGDEERETPLTSFLDAETEFESQEDVALDKLVPAYSDKAEEEDRAVSLVGRFMDHEEDEEAEHSQGLVEEDDQAQQQSAEDNEMSAVDFQDGELEHEAEMKAGTDTNAEEAEEKGDWKWSLVDGELQLGAGVNEWEK